MGQWLLPDCRGDTHLNCHQSKVADILTDSSAKDLYRNVIKSNRNSNYFSQGTRGGGGGGGEVDIGDKGKERGVVSVTEKRQQRRIRYIIYRYF